MTKPTTRLPLTISLQIPTYWTPEQALAVFDLINDLRDAIGSATPCRSRMNIAISSRPPPITPTKISAIRPSEPEPPLRKKPKPSNRPLVSPTAPSMRSSSQPLTHVDALIEQGPRAARTRQIHRGDRVLQQRPDRESRPCAGHRQSWRRVQGFAASRRGHCRLRPSARNCSGPYHCLDEPRRDAARSATAQRGARKL